MNQTVTILVVDDDLEGRKLIARLLNEIHYNLVFARNGDEAIQQAKELVPDLILLDVMMPGLNGFEVCEYLRADPILAEVPIVMLTSLDDLQSKLTGISAGADDFLTKPFEVTELKARVQTITRLNRYRHLLVERVKFEWVVDKAEDGYLMIDPNGKILYGNSIAHVYLGLDTDISIIEEQDFLSLAKKQYRLEPVLIWEDWPNLSTEHAKCYLVRPETSSSHIFWLEVSTLTLPTGAEAGRIVHLKNVTDQVNLQREIYSFHTMISHKLRTPLVGILSGLELMLEYAYKSTSTDIIEVGEIALRNVQRLRGQIDDIVEYIYMPSLVEDNAQFDLNKLPLIVTKLSANLELESIVVLGLNTLTNPHIRLAQRSIELILWELLENCKKFHPQHSPTVEITASPLDSNRVRLQISDNGIHLSPDQLSKVFVPYYQGDKYFTGEIKGMGLGLSMVASLTWESNSTCHIYNKEDDLGVIVELNLPLVDNKNTT